MKLIWAVFPLVLMILTIGVIVISANDVYAQCIDESCVPSSTITKKHFENIEPYPIRHLKLYNYDDQGNLIKRVELNKKNGLASWEIKAYDEKNNLIEWKKSHPGNSSSHHKYGYVFGNNFAVRTSIDSNNEIDGRFIQYTNNGGKIIKHQSFDSKGKPSFTSFYDYDGAGQTIESKEFFGERFLDWIKIEYDQNNIVNKKHLQPDGEIETMISYEYKDGKKTSKKIFNGKSRLSEIEYWYDKNGNLVVEREQKMWEWDKNGEPAFKREFWTGEVPEKTFRLMIYDENNNMIEKKVMDGKGVIKAWIKLGYDDDGNWTDRKVFYKNGNLKDWQRYSYENGKISKFIMFDVPKPYQK